MRKTLQSRTKPASTLGDVSGLPVIQDLCAGASVSGLESAYPSGPVLCDKLGLKYVTEEVDMTERQDPFAKFDDVIRDLSEIREYIGEPVPPVIAKVIDRQYQRQHPFEYFVNIQGDKLWQPVRCQQPIHQRLQPVCFHDDDLRVLLEFRVRQLTLQQLRRAANAAQRILDFVGQVTDELTVQLLMFENFLFADNFHLLVLLVKLKDEALPFGRRSGAGGVKQGCSGCFKCQFVFAEARIVFDDLIEHGKQRRVSAMG